MFLNWEAWKSIRYQHKRSKPDMQSRLRSRLTCLGQVIIHGCFAVTSFPKLQSSMQRLNPCKEQIDFRIRSRSDAGIRTWNRGCNIPAVQLRHAPSGGGRTHCVTLRCARAQGDASNAACMSEEFRTIGPCDGDSCNWRCLRRGGAWDKQCTDATAHESGATSHHAPQWSPRDT